MRLSPIAIVRRLGLRGFLQLVTHLANFLKLFSRLVKDPRVPLSPKLLVVGILAYVILPTDLLPDFIPGLGQVDDLIVIFFGLRWFLRLCPSAVVQEQVEAIAAGC